MSITVSATPEEKYTVIGNRALVNAKITMGSSYPYGGESFDPEPLFGMHNVDLALINQSNGLSLQYDATNKKLKAYRQAPPIVYEEKHTPTGEAAVQTITTKYPPAFFLNAGRIAASKKWRSTAVTPSDDEIALSAQMAAGERATLNVKDYDRLGGNGAFAADTNWTGFAAADWTCDSGAKKAADGTTALTHATAAAAGAKYLLTFTVSDLTAGSFTPSIGSTDGTAVSADGDYEMVITATDTAALIFTPTSASRFVITSAKYYKLDEPVYITYITQAWKDVWENLVQDESITLASGAATSLTYAPLAVMYADRTSATAKALTLVDEDDTAASGEVAIYLNQAADNVKASHADENGKVALVTYIKNPGAGFLADRAFDNEGAAKAGEDPYTNTFDYPILLWGYCGQVPVNGGTTQTLLPYHGTPTAGTGVLDWFTPGIRGAAAPAAGTVFGSKSDVTATGAGVWGTINEIVTQPLEVPNGEDLSAAGEFNVILIGI